MKIWQKTKDFCRKHKTAIVATLSGIGGTIGGIMIFKHIRPVNESIPEIDEVPKAVENEEDDLSWADPMYKTIIGYENKCEEGKNIWFEQWRDNWNKVNDLASEIKPFPGEYYVIEGTNPDCNGEHAEWFVHHWEDDRPGYPIEMVVEQVKKE